MYALQCDQRDDYLCGFRQEARLSVDKRVELHGSQDHNPVFELACQRARTYPRSAWASCAKAPDSPPVDLHADRRIFLPA